MRQLTKDILICNEIKYMIENQPILEGQKLPGERELSNILNVQRSTVRKGLKILLQEGWIYSKKRSGYYVSPKRITKDVYYLSSTTNLILSMGKEMKLQVLEIKEAEIGKRLSPKIKLPIGSKIFLIVRLRQVENEHVSIDFSYIPTNIAPTLLEKDFENNSLYTILEDDFLIDLDYSKQEISVEKANKRIANYLDVEEGATIVKQEGLVYSRDHKPVEYSISYMKANRFIYSNIKESD